MVILDIDARIGIYSEKLKEIITIAEKDIDYTHPLKAHYEGVIDGLFYAKKIVEDNMIPEGRLVEEWDLGINFNGYPLENTEMDVLDAIIRDYDTMKRVTKNKKYKLVLLEVAHDKKDKEDSSIQRP